MSLQNAPYLTYGSAIRLLMEDDRLEAEALQQSGDALSGLIMPVDDEDGISIDLRCDLGEVLQSFVYAITQGAKSDRDLPVIHRYIRNKTSCFRLRLACITSGARCKPYMDDEVRQRNSTQGMSFYFEPIGARSTPRAQLGVATKLRM